MPGKTRIQRLLTFLINLSSEITYSVREFNKKLGISSRSFYRGELTLEDAGIPVEHKNGWYWTEKNAPPLKSLGASPIFRRASLD